MFVTIIRISYLWYSTLFYKIEINETVLRCPCVRVRACACVICVCQHTYLDNELVESEETYSRIIGELKLTKGSILMNILHNYY